MVLTLWRRVTDPTMGTAEGSVTPIVCTRACLSSPEKTGYVVIGELYKKTTRGAVGRTYLPPSGQICDTGFTDTRAKLVFPAYVLGLEPKASQLPDRCFTSELQTIFHCEGGSC